MSDAGKPYPSDVSDPEREFLAPYLTLMREDAPQRGIDGTRLGALDARTRQMVRSTARKP